jgi:hypothetical protein
MTSENSSHSVAGGFGCGFCDGLSGSRFGKIGMARGGRHAGLVSWGQITVIANIRKNSYAQEYAGDYQKFTCL